VGARERLPVGRRHVREREEKWAPRTTKMGHSERLPSNTRSANTRCRERAMQTSLRAVRELWQKAFGKVILPKRQKNRTEAFHGPMKSIPYGQGCRERTFHARPHRSSFLRCFDAKVEQ